MDSSRRDATGTARRQSGFHLGVAIVLGLALLTSSLAGCLNRNMHSLDKKPDDKTYFHDGQYILIHEDGYAFDPDGNVFPSTNKFEQYLDGVVKPRIAKFLKEQEKEQEERPDAQACRGRLRVLIFVHGGLNTYEAGFKRMQKLWPQGDGGGLKGSCYFPIFLNWNSDLLSALYDDFFRVRFGRTDKALSAITSPFLLVKRVVESVGSLPLSFVHNYLNIRESQEGAWEEGDPLYCIVGDTLLHLPLQALYIGTIPFLEGFGGGAWQIMKRRAELSVASNLEDPPDYEYAFSHSIIPLLEAPPTTFEAEGAVRTFVRQFRSWLTTGVEMTGDQKSGEKKETEFVGWPHEGKVVPVEVTLVGHSAGSLIVDRMLAMADEKLDARPPLPVAHLIHAGPVAPILDWDDLVLPYLTRHFGNGTVKPDYSLFNLNRRDEVREMPAGYAFIMPRGSLVVWVDVFLQRETTLGQSTSGWERNVQEYFKTSHRRGVPGEGCFGPSWNMENGPPPEQLPVKTQYRLLPVKPPAPLTPHEFKVFKSPRRLGAKNVPRVHSDFDEPNFFSELLCHVDDRAFKDPKFCDRPPDW